MENLTSLLTKIHALLGDESGLRFSDSLLTQTVRICLAEVNLAAGAAHTLAGLDESAATSLPPEALVAIALGAAGCAVRGFNLSRAWQHPLNQPLAAEITRLGEGYDAQFSAALAALRRRGMALSDQEPYSTWEGE